MVAPAVLRGQNVIAEAEVVALALAPKTKSM